MYVYTLCISNSLHAFSLPGCIINPLNENLNDLNFPSNFSFAIRIEKSKFFISVSCFLFACLPVFVAFSPSQSPLANQSIAELRQERKDKAASKPVDRYKLVPFLFPLLLAAALLRVELFVLVLRGRVVHTPQTVVVECVLNED